MATITGDYLQTAKFRQASANGYGGAGTAETSTSQRVGTGVGANQANLMSFYPADATDGLTVGAATNVDFDLTALLDADSDAIAALAEVCYLRIEAVSSNGATLEIKPSAANGWTSLLKDPTDIIQLPPGCVYTFECWTAAALAVAGANKSINVANSDGSSAYLGFHLLGRNA